MLPSKAVLVQRRRSGSCVPSADTISYQHEALYVPQHLLKGGALEIRTGIAIGWTFLTRIDTPARSSLTGVSILVISIAKGGGAASVGGQQLTQGVA